MIVASTTATFGIPEVKRCLVAAGGGLFRLATKLPPNLAMEMALTGDPINAERAWHFGLINRLAQPGETLGAAIALATSIEASTPVAVRATRRVMIGCSADESKGWQLSEEAHGRSNGMRGQQGGPCRIHREASAGLEGPLIPPLGPPGRRSSDQSRPTGRQRGRWYRKAA